MLLKTSGIITPDATIAIGPGLPNDTSTDIENRDILQSIEVNHS